MNRNLVLCIALILSLTACNTIQGVGEDLSAAGEGVAHTAEKAKEKITK